MENKINIDYSKSIYIISKTLQKKRVVSVGKKHNYCQRLIARLFNINIDYSNKYQYMWQVRFKGKLRIKKNNPIINKNGVVLSVLYVNKNIATLVTLNGYLEEPHLKGESFYLVPKLN